MQQATRRWVQTSELCETLDSRAVDVQSGPVVSMSPEGPHRLNSRRLCFVVTGLRLRDLPAVSYIEIVLSSEV